MRHCIMKKKGHPSQDGLVRRTLMIGIPEITQKQFQGIWQYHTYGKNINLKRSVYEKTISAKIMIPNRTPNTLSREIFFFSLKSARPSFRLSDKRLNAMIKRNILGMIITHPLSSSKDSDKRKNTLPLLWLISTGTQRYLSSRQGIGTTTLPYVESQTVILA